MSGVLVSHPHAAAVASGLAGSLARAGKLSAFVTGVAFSASSWSGRLAGRLADHRAVLRNRILNDVGPHQLRALRALEIGTRTTGWICNRAGVPLKPYDLIFAGHDALTSAVPWPAGTASVYAYEDGALWTLQRARRQDLERIWDLPTPHYLTTEEIFRGEFSHWPGAAIGPPHQEPQWKIRRKDGELALATQISVASTFTKRSLERLDIRVPILVAPYGFPVDEFEPRTHPPSGRFTVLSVGSHDLRKGTPYLLEAWKRAAIPDAELHLVGPLRLSKTFLDSYAGLFQHWAHVPKSELGARYAAADLLVFPTLGDGFGLVIQEAMCCGTPVLTTPCGGGPECITDGRDGWLVPPRNLDALIDRLREAARDRGHAFRVGQAARARAERFTWQDAGQNLVSALGL